MYMYVHVYTERFALWAFVLILSWSARIPCLWFLHSLMIHLATMASKWSIFVIILIIINFGVSTNVTFGGCQPENQTCTDCYHKLKESLLKRDINVRSLSVAFFPPKHNIPEFVTVKYCFDENCDLHRIWYWTHDSSFLFFPLQTFQYLSLFFGKPAALFSQNVTLVLDGNCYGAMPDMFRLLTQRVSYKQHL